MPLQGSEGPLVVDDLDSVKHALALHGDEIIKPENTHAVRACGQPSFEVEPLSAPALAPTA